MYLHIKNSVHGYLECKVRNNQKNEITTECGGKFLTPVVGKLFLLLLQVITLLLKRKKNRFAIINATIF